MTDFKAARKIVGMAIFSVIICFFVQISFYVLISQLSTKVVGYDIYYVESEGDEGTLYGYFPKDEVPEDLDSAHYKAVSKYSEIPKSAKAVEAVLSTICSLGIFGCVTGTVLANAAAKDRNDSDFNDGVYDKTRGLKIGLLAAIPSAVFYIAAIVLRFTASGKAADWYYWFYRFVALGPVKPINDALVGVGTVFSKAPLWWVLGSGLYIVLFVGFCYAMYRICYNEDSWLAKLLYKSTQKKEPVRRLGGR